jgi:hypothetical protein
MELQRRCDENIEKPALGRWGACGKVTCMDFGSLVNVRMNIKTGQREHQNE